MQLQDLKSQLTLVFPVRIDCEERRENLRVVLRQLDGLGCRMLVLEADAVPALGDEAWPDGWSTLSWKMLLRFFIARGISMNCCAWPVRRL